MVNEPLHWLRIFLIIAVLAFTLTGCSIEQFAVRKVADFLSAGTGDSTVYTGEEDPELLSEALPFALKLYESLLESDPENEQLLLATGQAFLLYSNVSVQLRADLLGDEDFEEKLILLERAKKLYLRARNYLFRALEIRHPDFRDYHTADQWEPVLDEMKTDDAPYLYWAALAWLAAYSVDTFDFELMVTLPRMAAILNRVLVLDEAHDEGGLHEVLISYYGSLPAEMGGSEEKARYHFERAVALSGGFKTGPYLALATGVSIGNQNYPEFKELLDTVLNLDVELEPKYRLLNIVGQRKAAWMLEHAEDFFLFVEEP